MKTRMILFAALLTALCTGCEDKESEVRVSLIDCSGWETCPDFHVSISDGLWSYDVVLSGSNRSAGPFPTRRSGILSVTVSLYSGSTETETQGTIELPIEDDWRWGVDFFIREDDPISMCFGCIGSESYELDPILGYEGNERMHIVWGGNWISNPVVY